MLFILLILLIIILACAGYIGLAIGIILCLIALIVIVRMCG